MIKEAEVDLAYRQAILVLEKCTTVNGFYAAYPGYQGVWSRDSIITSIGASLINNSKFKEAFKQSLITLEKNQSKKGQIPNAVLKNKTDYKSLDSSLWFIIGHYLYKKRYKDNSLFNKSKKNIDMAFDWLSYQDMGEDGLLEQLPTTDWQDAFPHRYGHTINTQVLWYFVLNLIGNKKDARFLKKKVNFNRDDGLWDKNNGYYLPWRWKNHGEFKELGEWFDTLANLLAIIFNLSNKNQSEKILRYIKENNIDKPFPIKALYPPIKKGTKDWQDYFNDCEARLPNHYLNGGIWTYIGGFYVLALIKTKRYEEAKKQLEILAKANLQKPFFSEWLNGITGRPGLSGDKSYEGKQAWSAGMYILAYESVKKKKVLILERIN